MKKSRLLLLLCGLPLAALAQQVYRWVDASGVVHFSQTPPTEGPYENVTSSLPQSTTYSGSGSTAGGDKAAKAEQKGAGGGDQATQAKADNAERCAKARERISFLEEKTAHRLMVTGPDGKPARMTDEQFSAQMDDAKSAAAKYCE